MKESILLKRSGFPIAGDGNPQFPRKENLSDVVPWNRPARTADHDACLDRGAYDAEGGLDLTAVRFDQLGPLYDRRFMLVDEDGKFLSQRNTPRLALITLLA